jgi:hypothetical protein
MDESSQGTTQRVVALCIAFTALLFAACGGGGGGGGSGGPPPPPPATFSYPSPQVYVVGTAITPLAPVATESLSNFAVEEVLSGGPLPLGLTLNPTTGVISGTPIGTVVNTWTITAQTASGQGVSANLAITVDAVGASVISYGASALTFTAGIAARTLTPQTGAKVTGWAITPQLPAGLSFSTTTGAITGTPTTALSPTMYTVTAQNSAGQQLSAQLTIEVDTQVLVDLGHNTFIDLLQFNGSSLLSEDQFGNWVLWNYGTAAMISSGTGCVFDQPGPLTCIRGPAAALAGNTAVIVTNTGFEVLSAATGALIANIPVVLDLASEDSGGAWWLLATDGSYIVAGTTQSLSAWSPSGQLLVSRSGNYSAAIPFASPGAIRIAVGPAGSNVVETVSIPSGADTVSPTFNGQFASWFVDGSAFLSTVGNTTLVYSDAVSQEAVLSTPASGLSGEGPWLWTTGSSLTIYALASPTTPVASYPCSGSVIASASTLGVFNSASNTVCVIDLSGMAPTEAVYTVPIATAGGLYAAASASQWVIGLGEGVLIDGASLSGTPRFFGYGAVLSVAGNASQIAIATASGVILYFNAVTLAQEGTIQLSSTQLALSPDGSILAAAPSALSNPANQSLNIYSLPSASLLYSWPYPASSNTTVTSIALSGSGSGTVLGQVLSNQTITVGAPTGGTPTFSTTGLQLTLSPDGTLIATSDTASPLGEVSGNFTDFATNVLQNNKLITAVSGWPVGWLGDSQLLVNTYQLDYLNNNADYNGCAIYSPAGMSAGTCDLPQILSFQTVTSDTLYALNLNEIVSVSTGVVSWASGDAASGESPTSPLLAPSSSANPAYADALAGNHVIFVSGSKVVAQSY